MIPLAALALSVSLHFEPNVGQAPGGVRWTAAANGYSLLLSDTAVKMRLEGGVEVEMSLPKRSPEGLGILPGKSNYYLGSHPQVGVPQYARVRYRGVYPGIDLEIYGKGQETEYDWTVAPGADPGAIRMRFTGARPRVDEAGDLVFDTSAGQVRHRKPRVVQGEQEVAGEFVVGSDGQVGFRVGDYDRRKVLVIDPQIVWATGFGGSGYTVNYGHGPTPTRADLGTGIATDSSGNVYVTGTTFSTNFPVVNPLQTSFSCPTNQNCGFASVFVAKLSPDGSTLLYSTYFAPPLQQQSPYFIPTLPGSIAVDGAGNAYITGATDGTNLPTPGLKTAGGTDAFVLKLESKGALVNLRLFGGKGDDAGTALRFAADGTLLLAGTTKSVDFPTTPAAYRTKLSSEQDVFLIRIGFNSLFNPQMQGAVLYSTYLGPGDTASVAGDSSGNAYIAASTTSASWSTTSGVVQPKCAGSSCADIVVAKVDASGSTLLYATYLGGSDRETLGGIDVDATGSAYVAGTTVSLDFPTTPNAIEPSWIPGPQYGQYGGTAFAAKLSPDATSLVYATYISGNNSDQGLAIAVGAKGNAYVVGRTTSPNFFVSGAVQTTLFNHLCPMYSQDSITFIGEVPCASAGFLSVLTPDGSNFVWSTFLGSGTAQAVAVDSAGSGFVTGESITPGASRVGTVGVVKLEPAGTPLTFYEQRAITNGASFAPGLPLPGGLASIFLQGSSVTGMETATGYPLPKELAGVSILVDGVPAPILAVVAPPAGISNSMNIQQINFQVPFEAKSNVVEVRYKGVSTFAIPPQVAPGLFALPDGLGAIEHGTDYSLVTNGNPAKRGEVVIIYLTGLGLVNPAPVTGAAATQAAAAQIPSGCERPSLNVGEVLYAGITPGFAGLYQLNVRLSATLASGIHDVQLRLACFPPLLPDSFTLSNTVKLAVE